MGKMRDLIVIGCGPAGASAALAAARRGLDVLVLEKKSAVGSPVRCGEYVSALILKDIPPMDGFVAQAAQGLEVSLPSGEVLRTSSPGLMIERDRFDRALAKAAEDAGAEIITSAQVTGILNDRVRVALRGEESDYRGRVIIGADGPRSLAAKTAGAEDGSPAVGLQERLPLTGSLDHALIYYNHQYEGGYAWVFPRGSMANVGLALDSGQSKNLQALYGDFKRCLIKKDIISSEQPVSKTCGLIPVTGLNEKVKAGNLLLAGDAAGTTNPLTGAGIAPAVISGKLAGELAAEAVNSGDLSVLNVYREECAMALPLERTTAIKKEIDSHWGTQRGDALLKNYWEGFVGGNLSVQRVPPDPLPKTFVTGKT